MLEALAKITPEFLSTLSIPELESLNRELAEGQKSIREYRIMISDETSKKELQAAAKRKLAVMNDAEKKALLQELEGVKIASEETVKSAE